MGKKLGGFDSLFQEKIVEDKHKTNIIDQPINKPESGDDISIVRTFRIKRATAQALKISAAKHNLKMGETIDAAIELYFKTYPNLK